jgi:hypothetical protein
MSLNVVVGLVAILSSATAGINDQPLSTPVDTLMVGGLKRTFGLYVPPDSRS